MLNLSRKKSRNIGRTLLLISVILLLNSCLTIETDMKINSNGSGTMAINYTLDKGLKDISNLDTDDNIVPLNLNVEYLEEVTSKRDDVTYRNYKITEGDDYYNIEVVIVFETIEGLNSILPEDNSVIVEKKGSETLFTQVIADESEADISEESLKIFKDIFKDHYFTLKVNVPSDIRSVENGIEVSDRVAVYQESFVDLISSNDKRSWSVRW